MVDEIIKKNRNNFSRSSNLIVFFLIILVIYLTNFYSYLLFHSAAELFSIIIAFGIFAIGWNTRKIIDSSLFLILGVSFVFIGSIDLIHTLAYKGMNIFLEYDANLATELWIAARYLQAFSFLLAFLYVEKSINPNKLVFGYVIITSILFISIFSGFFPECYIEGSGLTPFKIISEYIIISILTLGIFLLHRNRKGFNKRMFQLMSVVLFTTILSELSFTLYIGVYDIFNLIGHTIKIITFYLIYLAIIQKGIEDPASVLFTKLKKSEESLAIKAEDLEQAYSEANQIFNAALPLRIIDTNGKIIRVNRTFLNLFQYELENVIEKNCFEVMPHERCHTERCCMNQVLNGIQLMEYEINIKRKDGKNIFLIVHSVPYMSKSGKFLGIIQNYTDITERKRAENKIKYLISTVSHEIRTPITVLLMSIEYIKQKGGILTPEIQQQIMEGAERNIHLLKELSESILVVSQIDENKIEINLKDYKLSKIVEEISSFLIPLTSEKLITISIEIDGSIKLRGDINRIDKVFRILLDNAIKYSMENSVIEVKAINKYQGKYNINGVEGVLISIKDEGIGISKEELPQIFERFYRASNVKDIPGTGLGLSIARDLIELHNGKIFIESELNKGTTFYVFFPML